MLRITWGKLGAYSPRWCPGTLVLGDGAAWPNDIKAMKMYKPHQRTRGMYRSPWNLWIPMDAEDLIVEEDAWLEGADWSQSYETHSTEETVELSSVEESTEEYE